MISNTYNQPINQAVFLAIIPFCSSKPFLILYKQFHASLLPFIFIKDSKEAELLMSLEKKRLLSL
ncbi:hypothetical protein RO3G_05739 [Rhizopus delemar RA 99-880]|uniref:Uncharacterized protein n=1 Tax=Rhizopus delemar (strain RA 99-880 / ATCC MYA-4621 / FGSC 9543 / NRRL 43880) TaxID=246409 RepID=I1BXV4_RHIO9|nr:hypothetical protein RO3G_05739 [Rhizopus delemar RA 99-880]|eukprot:EIE81034.1 hypothetical protein RO3G_05739 [Rhizopus delemar RA 99-880]